MKISDMKSLKKALQISTFYFIFGMLWIYISDDIAEVLSFGNLHQLTVLQNFKGWFFIIITTLLLFRASCKSPNPPSNLRLLEV